MGRGLISFEPNQLANTAVIDYNVIAHAKGDNRPYLKVQIYDREILRPSDSGYISTVIGKAGWDILKSVNSNNRL